jgi:hypothetical protein
MGKILDLARQFDADRLTPPVARPGALSGPPAAAPVAIPGPDPAPWELLVHPADPRERLILYLDTWAGMDEATWPEANVKALYEDLLELFGDHPEAEGWYRDWRTAHPEARLC